MTRHRGLGIYLVLGLLASGCGPHTGTTKPPEVPPGTPVVATPQATDPLDVPIPLDARIQHGKLANGLTYYILPHKKPEKRAQLWLAVNAGSVLEDEDQRGLAHFVEHMGFNGTKRFPKQDLVNFLETIGVKFGPDLNAYTSFDQTVYMLQVPTDKPEIVEKAFFVLRDWAGDVSFTPEEVEKERGVVLEEWRLGRGAGMRIFDKQAPVLFHGSRYADRITIGKPEIIKEASRDTLMRFYRDWYRPDLMAVIAVGDFVPADIEKLIKGQFSDLKNPDKPRARQVIDVPAHEETLVSIETDPEMPRTTVQVVTKMAHRPEASERDFRRFLVESVYHSMLNDRLDELRRRPNAPFLFAGSSTGGYVRSTDAFTQFAMVKEDTLEAGLEVLLQEAARVEKHGFLASELERTKKDMLRSFQRSAEERDKQDGRAFADEMTRNFFEAEFMCGPEKELELAEKYLPTITLEELHHLAGSWRVGGSRAILVSGPDKMKKPAADALRKLVASVEGRELTPWEDAVSTEPLMAQAPAPGKVTETRTIPEIGVTEWTLSNGIHVVHKETDFKNDEVSFVAWSPGGTSLVPDKDYESARFADRVVGEGGLGSFDATQLRKLMAGKVAGAFVGLGELEETLSGRASPQDLETLFQLVHLKFTAPRKDAEAFEAWRAREIDQAKNRRLSPETVFFEDMGVLMAQDHPRRAPTTPEMLAKVDLDKAMKIYQDRFADAGDFTFVFVGNVSADKLKGLAETYLASLPSKGRKEKWKDVNVHHPIGVKEKVIKKGQEPKSRVLLVFHGGETWSKDHENDMRMLGEVLSIRLREVLREDMGGVYGVSAGGRIDRRPKQEYAFTVQFGCAPENVDKLKQAVFDEIKAIQDKGIGDDYLTKVKEARKRAHETNLKENGFWVGELRRAFTFGDEPKDIPDIQPMIDQISSDRVRAAAKKYLLSKQYVLGVLEPEAPAAPKP
jgi:zinc protease